MGEEYPRETEFRIRKWDPQKNAQEKKRWPKKYKKPQKMPLSRAGMGHDGSWADTLTEEWRSAISCSLETSFEKAVGCDVGD